MRWGALRKIKVKLRVTLAPLGNEWFGLASRHCGVYKIYAGSSHDIRPYFLRFDLMQGLTVRGKALEPPANQSKHSPQQMQAY